MGSYGDKIKLDDYAKEGTPWNLAVVAAYLAEIALDAHGGPKLQKCMFAP